jgi:alkylation response protein AidB-like acyl-CoA dehydrogenase
MPRFPGVDYIQFDSLLSEQELLVRQTARQFVDERVVPIIREAYNSATFPAGLIREMGELGFFGANLNGYGCAGMNNIEYGLIMQELERGGTEAALASEIAVGRSGGLLRPYRTGLRLESRRHARDGRKARR